MTSALSVQLQGISETLMITLYARAVEHYHPKSLLLDPKAAEIANQLNYDFSKFGRRWSWQLGCVIRASRIDHIVQNFMRTHPYAIVVNLGAGLCTRCSRLETAQVQWYDIDFPEVIDLRRQFFKESDHSRMIAKSILDFTWMDDIVRAPKQPMMIIYEGVAMYLSVEENKALLHQIQTRFRAIEILFDVIDQRTACSIHQHDPVAKTNAEFKWGIDRSSDLSAWESCLILKREEFYLKHFLDNLERLPPIWRFSGRILPSLLILFFKHSSRIVELQVGIP